MIVLDELKKSIKLLEQAAKDLNKIDTLGGLDVYEPQVQKIVFNLQMQANQVAGELAPAVAAKRTELRNASAQKALERIRAAKEGAIAAAQPEVEEPKVEEPKVEETKVEEPKVEVEEPKVEEPKVEETKVEEPKVEDGADGDRQSESNAGDSKPKSTKKAK